LSNQTSFELLKKKSKAPEWLMHKNRTPSRDLRKNGDILPPTSGHPGRRSPCGLALLGRPADPPWDVESAPVCAFKSVGLCAPKMDPNPSTHVSKGKIAKKCDENPMTITGVMRKEVRIFLQNMACKKK